LLLGIGVQNFVLGGGSVSWEVSGVSIFKTAAAVSVDFGIWHFLPYFCVIDVFMHLLTGLCDCGSVNLEFEADFRFSRKKYSPYQSGTLDLIFASSLLLGFC
jgi:hypothetical protein